MIVKRFRLWLCRHGWHSKKWVLASDRFDTCTVCRSIGPLEVLRRVDHTLAIYGHMDAETDLHKLIQDILYPDMNCLREERLDEADEINSRFAP